MEQALEELAVVWDAKVKQFFHNHALAKFGVLAQEVGVKTHPSGRGATAPFPLHGAHLHHFRLYPDAFGPDFHLGLEHIPRNRLLQRLPLSGRGGSHGLARRSSFISFSLSLAKISSRLKTLGF
jgi:hypothetical protein